LLFFSVGRCGRESEFLGNFFVVRLGLEAVEKFVLRSEGHSGIEGYIVV